MKNQLFSNFKHKQLNPQSNNELFIEDMYNINTLNGFIQTEQTPIDLLSYLLNNSDINQIINNNCNTLSKLYKLIPYHFFNSIENAEQTRFFLLTTDNLLYELNPNNNIFEEKYIFQTKPIIHISQNILYLFDSNNKTVVIENQNIITIENTPCIKFYTYDNNHIYFTTQNNPNTLYLSETCKFNYLSQNLTPRSQT